MALTKQAAAKSATRVSPAHARLRLLKDALKENLNRCAEDPDEDAVHDTRTGTRRIEAALEAAFRDVESHAEKADNAQIQAARAWERLLKAIRRAAAPVRDLDVQRKFLKKLAKPERELNEQAQKLEQALEEKRKDQSTHLRKNASQWAIKLDQRFEEFTALQHPVSRRSRRNIAAATALTAFAQLATRMRQLDSGNLHDFRKGVKKARYMAEAGNDEYAESIGKALKKLQDAIGDWHDWQMLSEEAHRVLGDEGVRLTVEIESTCTSHFEQAVNLSAKMRGSFMGEWLALHDSATVWRARNPKKA